MAFLEDGKDVVRKTMTNVCTNRSSFNVLISGIKKHVSVTKIYRNGFLPLTCKKSQSPSELSLSESDSDSEESDSGPRATPPSK